MQKRLSRFDRRRGRSCPRRSYQRILKEKSRTLNSRYVVMVSSVSQAPIVFAHQVSTRMTSLTASWHSAKVVRTRDKISFFGGVMSLLISALLFGMAPQCVNLHSLIRGRLIYCTQVGSYLIYAPSIISASIASLQVQETLLALLLV